MSNGYSVIVFNIHLFAGIYRFAEVHACVDLCSISEGYIHNHFLDVVEHDEYPELPKDLLLKFLQSEDLNIESEFQVFTAAMKWILHDTSKRRRFIFEVMGPIRFPIISQKLLGKYIDDCKDLSLKIALRKLVQDFRQDRKMPYEMKLTRVKPYLLQPRKCSRKTIYMIGGYTREIGGRWSDSHTLCSVESFNSFCQQWKSIPPLRHARSCHGVCITNGLIYVFGGESDSLIYDNAECFDPTANKWSVIPSMTMPRCGLGACAVEDQIYAIGGWIGSEIGDSVERFDPQLGHWSHWDKVQTLRFAMGVVAHQGK